MKDEAPPPAEAATDVGLNDDDGLETIGRVALFVIVIFVVVAVVSLLAGYYL
jgi:hypothetical protein